MELVVKNPTANVGDWVLSLGWEIPWRRAWQSTLVILPRESHGQKGLVHYNPKVRKEFGMTEAT